jgi:hypothetical protein
LIVPLVADFAGVHAIRAVSRYLKEHDATVATFYMSNVEEYLFKSGSWRSFVANLSTLPMTEQSMIIRAFFTHTDAGLRTLLEPMAGYLAAVKSGEINNYADVISRSTVAQP